MRHSATGRPRSARALFEHGRRRASRAASASAPAFVAATLAVSASTVAIGCGEGAQKREARALEGASILSDTAPLEQRLIKPSEIAAAPDSAARRTFLQLWSTLQFGAWDRAEQFFEPGLRSTIGPALLAEGLQQYLLIWQATKPRLVTAKVSGETATITFLARDEKDHVVPASISFTRSAGAWLVSYFSLLDGALQRAAQLTTQAQLEPLGTKPSAEAVREGNAAAALQSTYLERRQRPSAAGEAGGSGRRR